MNNKPVAWMNPTGLEYKQRSTDFMYNDSLYDPKLDWIPLYTHPAKDKPHPKCDEACMYLCRMRELTDEEIMEIVADKYEKGHGRYIDTKLFFVEFAKAILRKAQEK